MTPADSLKLRTLAAARAQPPPRPAAPRATALGLTVLAALAMLAVMEWVPGLLGDRGGLAHAAGRPAGSTAGIFAGALVLALAATWIAGPFRRSMLSAPRGVLLAVAIAVPIGVGLWLVTWHATYEDPFVRTGWRCLLLTALTAPWPFAVLVHAGPRVEPRHPGALGAALGACAGAWAAVMVVLWCPLATPGHVLVGHVLPLAVLSLAGAGLGARTFRLRPLSPGRPRPHLVV